MAQCSVSDLSAQAACFTCLPGGYILSLRLALWSQLLVAKGGTLPSIAELAASAACFLCLTPGQMQIARLQLLCNLLGGNVAYASSLPVDATVVDGDPLFPEIIIDSVNYSAPYQLGVASDLGGTSSVLSWTWPSTFTPTPMAFGQPIFPVTALYLQRATSVSNMPHNDSPFRIHDPFVGPNDIADGIAIALAQPGWTTIAQWSAPDLNSLPKTYTDPTGPNTFYSYRLIAFLGSGPSAIEMDWNVVTIVQPYTLTLCTTSQTCQPRLTWTAPQDLGLYITSWSHFSAAGACSAGCYRLDYNPASPLPLRYNVFKSYDGMTFNNVTTIDPAPTGAASWYDSDPTHNIAYRFQAVYANGSLIDSNTINASY